MVNFGDQTVNEALVNYPYYFTRTLLLLTRSIKHALAVDIVKAQRPGYLSDEERQAIFNAGMQWAAEENARAIGFNADPIAADAEDFDYDG